MARKSHLYAQRKPAATNYMAVLESGTVELSAKWQAIRAAMCAIGRDRAVVAAPVSHPPSPLGVANSASDDNRAILRRQHGPAASKNEKCSCKIQKMPHLAPNT